MRALERMPDSGKRLAGPWEADIVIQDLLQAAEKPTPQIRQATFPPIFLTWFCSQTPIVLPAAVLTFHRVVPHSKPTGSKPPCWINGGGFRSIAVMASLSIFWAVRR
ncbi:hypothetical protein BD779DRAFT_1551583 [Infundibulicybe gibba]|nr:hypothetical protein BD779DRAFT_1551583 [Infundibulicybe gibba]